MEPILSVEHLRRDYGGRGSVTHAVDDVSFSVERGEFVGIMGASGSGKSTLLHMLGGLDTPTSGEVFVDGKKLSELKKEQLAIFRRRKVGFVFQNYNLVPDLNVYENIVLPIELDGGYVDEKFIGELLDMLHLQEKAEALPGTLSGGQQQRVAIARALASKPAIILADEPTGNLDSASSKEILAILKKMHKTGRTVILITHDNGIAAQARRVVRIMDGKIESDTINPDFDQEEA